MKIALAAFVVLATIAVNTVMVDCGDSVIDHEGSICYRNWWKKRDTMAVILNAYKNGRHSFAEGMGGKWYCVYKAQKMKELGLAMGNGDKVENEGKECWKKCGKFEGACPYFCGPGGVCCRLDKWEKNGVTLKVGYHGFEVKYYGCYGGKGQNNHHRCTRA